jgi:hypothetical protein
MGRIPWDCTIAAAVSSRSQSSVPKFEVGKRVRVSPPVAPRFETSVYSANVMEETSVPICVLSHDIFKIQVEVQTTESNPKSVLTEACIDTGAGCVLIREDAVPKCTSIIELQETPRLATTKGETLSVLGTCDLFVNIAGETASKKTEFMRHNLCLSNPNNLAGLQRHRSTRKFGNPAIKFRPWSGKFNQNIFQLGCNIVAMSWSPNQRHTRAIGVHRQQCLSERVKYTRGGHANERRLG